MNQLDPKEKASKGQAIILLSEDVQAYDKVAVDCTRMGLQCVFISSEDEALEWLWANGRQLQKVVLDDEFRLRVSDSFPATLVRDWPDVSVIKLSHWLQTFSLGTVSRKA